MYNIGMLCFRSSDIWKLLLQRNYILHILWYFYQTNRIWNRMVFRRIYQTHLLETQKSNTSW